MTRSRLFRVLAVSLLVSGTAVLAQNERQFVQQAVNNELAKDQADHSHWLYYEVDQKPVNPVKQWVAETTRGSLKRIIVLNGRALPLGEQRSRMNKALADDSVLSRQRKSEAHDDKQATELLQMLPNAFIWTRVGERGNDTILHFKPNPDFNPPDFESKVFAAMEGDMAVDTRQLRIASLRGRLTQDVKIWGGVLGELNAGGTFDVERRETGGGVWQITETHVHIQGHALIFKTISEQEDDVKSEFKELPANITLAQAKNDLLHPEEVNAEAAPPEPTPEETPSAHHHRHGRRSSD